MTVESVTYISDLNATYPAGSDAKSEGDDHIRNIKTGIKNTFPNISGAVSLTHTQLNYLSSITGTAGGGVKVDMLASATKMIFFQAAAPTGWTQVTTHNDKALRVVSTAGAGSGGTHGLSSPPSLAHTHTGPSHSHTYTTVISHTHTITTDTGGGHSHNVDYVNVGAGTTMLLSSAVGASGAVVNSIPTSSVSSHTHTGTTDSTGSASASTAAEGTGATGSTTPTAFAPQYIDVIVCSKD